jgi:hypothetical protein
MGQEQTCSHYIVDQNALLFADAVIRRGAYILVCSASICLAECCYCLGKEQTCSHYILVKVLFFLQML